MQAVPEKFKTLDIKPTNAEVRRGWGLALYRLPEVLLQGSPAAQIAVAEVGALHWPC